MNGQHGSGLDVAQRRGGPGSGIGLLLAFVFCLAPLLVGCGDDSAPTPDAGSSPDAGERAPEVPGPNGWRAPVPLAFVAGGRPYLLELSDGRVLRIGGDGNGEFLEYSMELYEGGRWKRIEDLFGLVPTSSPGVTLADGSLLLAGGGFFQRGARLPTRNAWPNAYHIGLDGSVAEVAPMAAPRMFHQPIRLDDGKVLVSGGATVEGEGLPFVALSTTEVYDPVLDVWAADAELTEARFQHGAVKLANGDVLIVGGRDESGSFRTSVDRRVAASAAIVAAASLQTGRAAFAIAVLPSGRVLVAGGHTGPEATTASVEIYDPAADRWEEGPSLPLPLAFAGTVTLPNGAPLLVGGYERFPDAVASAFVFDEVANGWAAMDDLTEARFDPGVILLSSGAVLAVGGLGTGAPSTLRTSEESDGRFEP